MSERTLEPRPVDFVNQMAESVWGEGGRPEPDGTFSLADVWERMLREVAFMRSRLVEAHEYAPCSYCGTLVDYDGSFACEDRDCWGCGAIGSENENECDGVPDHCPTCHPKAVAAREAMYAGMLDDAIERGDVSADWRTTDAG